MSYHVGQDIQLMSPKKRSIRISSKEFILDVRMPTMLTFPQWRHHGQFFGQIGAFSMVNDQNTFGVCVCARAVFTLVEKHRAKSFYRSLVYQLSQLWPCSFYIIARTDPKKTFGNGGFHQKSGDPQSRFTRLFQYKVHGSLDPWIHGRTGWWEYHPLGKQRGERPWSRDFVRDGPTLCGTDVWVWSPGRSPEIPLEAWDFRSRSIQVIFPMKNRAGRGTNSTMTMLT